MNGYVYILAEWGSDLRYKIGITKNNVEKRVKQLKTGNSNEIKIINTFKSKNYKKIEKMLHRKFSMTREQGEWFSLTDQEVASFINECEKADENINFLIDHNSFYNP